MKKIAFFLLLLMSFAQLMQAQIQSGNYRKDLPEIYISKDVSLHFISPENISYVDISTNNLIGDFPLKNVLRVKIVPDSLKPTSQLLGVLTVVGESYMAQYNLMYNVNDASSQVMSKVNILPADMVPLDVSGITLTTSEMRKHALSILENRSKGNVKKTKAYGIEAKLNHIYTVGDHIFLDLTFLNHSNLKYDIDEIRFKIEDKKIVKATNNQSVEVEPLWQLYENSSFKKISRNIFVLKKATFPDNKVLNIELSEKQISGRTIILPVRYSDILKADNF